MKKIEHYTTQGHAHYITLVIKNRVSVFSNSILSEKCIQAIAFYQNNFEVRILGYVIMPDHIHLIVWPQSKTSLEDFVRDFKKYLAREILNQAAPKEKARFLLSTSLKRNHRYQVWQKDFYDFNIYSQDTLIEKLNYIHNNPQRKGLVENPEDYPYSSYRAYSEKGEILLSVHRI